MGVRKQNEAHIKYCLTIVVNTFSTPSRLKDTVKVTQSCLRVGQKGTQWSTSIATLILTTTTRHKCVVSFIPGHNLGTHWTESSVEPRAGLGGFGQEKNVLSFPAIKSRFFSSLVRNSVAVPTGLKAIAHALAIEERITRHWGAFALPLLPRQISITHSQWCL